MCVAPRALAMHLTTSISRLRGRSLEVLGQVAVDVQRGFAVDALVDALHRADEQVQHAVRAAQGERQRGHAQVALEQVQHQLPFALEPDRPVQQQRAGRGIAGQVAQRQPLIAPQQHQRGEVPSDHFIVRGQGVEALLGVPVLADVGPLHDTDAVKAEPGETLGPRAPDMRCRNARKAGHSLTISTSNLSLFFSARSANPGCTVSTLFTIALTYIGLSLVLDQYRLAGSEPVHHELDLPEHLRKLPQHQEHGLQPVLARGPATTARQARSLQRVGQQQHQAPAPSARLATPIANGSPRPQSQARRASRRQCRSGGPPCSEAPSANAYPARKLRRHHWPKRVMAASCRVISWSSRQIFQPWARRRMHNSGSSPAISAGR